MKLKDYLEKQDISLRQFAKKIKKDHTSVWRYCNGDRTPSLKIIKEITKATKGKVSYKDFE